MLDMLEGGVLYPPIGYCVDARAVYDAISASDACEPAGSSLKLHLISARDGMTHGLARNWFWVDTRDMLAVGLSKGGIDRLLRHSCSNDCKYVSKHERLKHSKVFGGSVAIPSAKIEEEGLLGEDSAEWAPGT